MIIFNELKLTQNQHRLLKLEAENSTIVITTVFHMFKILSRDMENIFKNIIKDPSRNPREKNYNN